jgi:NAD(P)-dependent dehydrogenase (short-subunit alcohol dehydrogenase family)
MAQALGHTGITVNAIAPDGTASPTLLVMQPNAGGGAMQRWEDTWPALSHLDRGGVDRAVRETWYSIVLDAVGHASFPETGEHVATDGVYSRMPDDGAAGSRGRLATPSVF